MSVPATPAGTRPSPRRTAAPRRERERERSISYRLSRAFVAYVLLLLLAGSVGVISVVTISSARAAEVRHQRLGDATTAMLLSMTEAQSSIRGYRLTGDRIFLEPYDAARQRFPGEVRRAMDSAEAADERRLVLSQEAIARYWLDEVAAPIAATDGRSEPTPEQARSFRDTFNRYREVNGRLDALAERRAAPANARALRAESVALFISVVALFLSLGLGAMLQQRLQRSLVIPLAGVVTTLGRLSTGHHDARADADAGPGEVRVVARSLNRLAAEADRLRAEQVATARSQRLAVAINRELRDAAVDGDPITVVLQRLGDALEVDRVYVRLVDGGAEEIHQWQRPPWAPMPPAEPYDHTATARLEQNYRQLQPWVIEDAAAQALEDEMVAGYVERTGARASLAVPIGTSDTAMGLITAMVLDGPRAWTPDEETLVVSVAADLGRALAVRRLLEQQELLVEQLRELDRTKTEFLSTVSHELRTPLTSIAGYVEMVREGDAGDVPPEIDAMLAVVERNTARLRQLIEDLLTLSRIESGTYRVVHEEVCVVQVVAMVAQSLHPAAERARVGVHLDLGGDPEAAALVSGDPGQLERVVTNLLSNAVKFTPAGGRVRLGVRAVEDRVVLEVADTGIGIPAEEQSQLFSRFFRASNASALAIPGTGLGLPIVRSIIEQHAGTLALASEHGAGTTVTVDLPRLPATATATAAPASRAVVTAAASPLHHEEVGTR